MINLDEILNQVKATEDVKIQHDRGGFKADPRLLAMKKHCTYTMRLIPYVQNLDAMFVTWKDIGWNSILDGSYIQGGRSPSDAGLKEDPFKAMQWETYSKAKACGDEVGQKSSYKLLPTRRQVVNAYLVAVDGDDPESKEKIGTVVALKYSASLDKKGAPVTDIYKRIHAAMFGDMVKKIGTRAMDLSDRGKSLIIKVTDKGGFHNYGETMFDDSESLGLSETDIARILKEAHDLQEFVPEVLPPTTIQSLLDMHWCGNNASADDEIHLGDESPPSGPFNSIESGNEIDFDELIKD